MIPYLTPGFTKIEDIANRALQHIGGNRITYITEASKNAREIFSCYNKLRQAEIQRNDWDFAIRRCYLYPLDVTSMLWTPPAWKNGATFTGTGAGTNLTASNVVGVISIGDLVTGTGVSANTTIVSQSSGPTGGAGVYVTNNVTTSSGAALTSGTTYGVGQVVAWDDGFGSRLWISNAPGNIGNSPGATGVTQWDNYFGQLFAQPFVSGNTYHAGDLVYETQTGGAFKVYLSLFEGTSDDPSVTDAWDPTVTYKKNAVIIYSAQNYISLVDGNINNTPASSPSQWATTSLTGSYQWVFVGTVLTAYTFLYPIGSGPSSQSSTKNICPLPYGFLSKTQSQDPKAGSVSWLGSPTNRRYDDWIIENGFLTTMEVNPIPLRFNSDMTVITQMHPMFCEGLACRIALEVCEIITQSTEKIKDASQEYGKFMVEARTKNAIENEATESPLDDYIACRY